MASITELREKFDGMSTPQKKQFITNLQKQLEETNNPSHKQFLNECKRKYIAEVQENTQSPEDSHKEPPQGDAVKTKKSKTKGILITTVLIIAAVVVGWIVARLTMDNGTHSPLSQGIVSSSVSPELSITVLTPFPSGNITDNIVDITYTVTERVSASVSEVFYSINGIVKDHIYISGDNGLTPKGSLNSARVLLVPGENNVTFTVIDTSDNTATYTVSEQPYYVFGSIPEPDLSFVEYLSDESGVRYVTNRIVAFAKAYVTTSQVEETISIIDGSIVGQINILDMYIIQVPTSSLHDLIGLCEKLIKGYPDVIENAFLDTIDPVDVYATSDATDDPWWGVVDEINSGNMNTFYISRLKEGAINDLFSDANELYKPRQWGLDAINASGAWDQIYHRRRGLPFFNTTNNSVQIRIGVVDGGFNYSHEDLEIPVGNIRSRRNTNINHGTHVMGVIGAIHNNAKGIAGVINVERSCLFGYDASSAIGGFTVTEVLAGLAWTVSNGAKVINFSVGRNEVASVIDGIGWLIDSPQFGKKMSVLLSYGYDFIIIQAAGNDARNAEHAGYFGSIPDSSDLRQRIITVGATKQDGSMLGSSNYGDRVDVVAPGNWIYSTTAHNNSEYRYSGGTSMAAPHVTGVAAMVWAVNPGLSGTQVKQIIVNSAIFYGRKIIDDRNSIPRSEWRTYHEINAWGAVFTATLGQEQPPCLKINVNNTSYGAIVESSVWYWSYGSDPTIRAYETVTLTAIPNSGYEFERWEVLSGSLVINDLNLHSVSFGLLDDVSIMAHFKAAGEYNITASVNVTVFGTARSNPSAALPGALITLTANPKAGYRFSHWQIVSGEVTISDVHSQTATFTMPNTAVHIMAIFAESEDLVILRKIIGTWVDRDFYYRGSIDSWNLYPPVVRFYEDGVVVQSFGEGNDLWPLTSYQRSGYMELSVDLGFLNNYEREIYGEIRFFIDTNQSAISEISFTSNMGDYTLIPLSTSGSENWVDVEFAADVINNRVRIAICHNYFLMPDSGETQYLVFRSTNAGDIGEQLDLEYLDWDPDGRWCYDSTVERGVTYYYSVMREEDSYMLHTTTGSQAEIRIG